ncbi:hypothetical protein GCM10029978_060070 [Actinoallomurus acanthiterrae]
MSVGEILLSILVGLVANEVSDISPWLAVRLVRWAAFRIYAADPQRAAEHAEDWQAHIDRSIPTKLGKLFFGLGFGVAALWRTGTRRAGHGPAIPRAGFQHIPRPVRVGVLIGVVLVAIADIWGPVFELGFHNETVSVIGAVLFGVPGLAIMCLSVLYGVAVGLFRRRRGPVAARLGPVSFNVTVTVGSMKMVIERKAKE